MAPKLLDTISFILLSTPHPGFTLLHCHRSLLETWNSCFEIAIHYLTWLKQSHPLPWWYYNGDNWHCLNDRDDVDALSCQIIPSSFKWSHCYIWNMEIAMIYYFNYYVHLTNTKNHHRDIYCEHKFILKQTKSNKIKQSQQSNTMSSSSPRCVNLWIDRIEFSRYCLRLTMVDALNYDTP